MFKIYALKAKVSNLKDAISEIDSLIEKHLHSELTAIEQDFYDRLQLPDDASAMYFFEKMNVGSKVKVAVRTLFIIEHQKSYQEYIDNPGSLPSDMRAVYGYLWLKNFDRMEILRFSRVGKKSVSELNVYLIELDGILNDNKLSAEQKKHRQSFL